MYSGTIMSKNNSADVIVLMIWQDCNIYNVSKNYCKHAKKNDSEIYTPYDGTR